MRKIKTILIAIGICVAFQPLMAQSKNTVVENQLYKNRTASIGLMGDTADIESTTKGGVVLMGGGKDVDDAFKWMIHRSGGGNVVILRAAGTNAYNSYIYGLDKVQSVETLKIDSRELANNDTVVRIIRNAEMLFIAGGDQSNYMRFWKGTKTADAINYLLNKKKIPVGGTSAGCAILGQMYYSGEVESSVSKTVLANPYHASVTLYNNDFLHPPFLDNVITDQHYVARSRQGRHMVFLSRIINDWNLPAKGIAADERTAVCINEKGKATVLGTGTAYFLQTSLTKKPEVCEAGKPLSWVAAEQAAAVYEISGSLTGNGAFDVRNFKRRKAKGGAWWWWWVEDGELKSKKVESKN